MPFRRRFQCEIFTPTERVASTEALTATFPASDGQVGVLGGRSAMVAMLGVGKITISVPDWRDGEFFVSRGFVRMGDNVLVFLAEECIPVAKLDAEAAWQELQDAQKLPSATAADVAARDLLIATARGKFDIAQKRRKKLGIAGGQMVEE